MEDAARRGDLVVVGLGMNRAELDANAIFSGGKMAAVWDLNESPDVSDALGLLLEGGKLDAATNVVSIDYLTDPVAVLRSLLAVMRDGGTVHLVVSNRCFPTKVGARWLRVGDEERVEMVGDFLHFAGWESIEVVVLSDGRVDESGVTEWSGWMPGLPRRDPLWVVRGTKR